MFGDFAKGNKSILLDQRIWSHGGAVEIQNHGVKVLEEHLKRE